MAASSGTQANRIEQYLDFMLCILRADGVVDPEEKRHLISLMVSGLKLEASLVDKYRRELEREDWAEATEAELAAIGEGLDASSLAHLVRDGYGMAASDGEIHETEVRVIQRFLVACGVPGERLPEIDLWARRSLALAHQGTVLLSRPSA